MYTVLGMISLERGEAHKRVCRLPMVRYATRPGGSLVRDWKFSMLGVAVDTDTTIEHCSLRPQITKWISSTCSKNSCNPNIPSHGPEPRHRLFTFWFT
jgi:hypothetical protein